METNGQFRDGIPGRLVTRGSAGELSPWTTGRASLEELRRLIIEVSEVCPAKQTPLECPFRILGTLSYASLTTLVSSLSRKACEDLFRMEMECRFPDCGAVRNKNRPGSAK